MLSEAEIERADLHLEELISRVQLALGRIAALRGQLCELDNDLMELESGTDELLQRLAHARAGALTTPDVVPEQQDQEGQAPKRT